MEAAIKFICLLYDQKSMTHDMNNLHYTLCTKKNLQSSKLPPTDDSVKLHLYRANCQSYIWKNTTAQFLVMPSPEGNGWIKDENRMLTPELMRNQPAPEN